MAVILMFKGGDSLLFTVTPDNTIIQLTDDQHAAFENHESPWGFVNNDQLPADERRERENEINRHNRSLMYQQGMAVFNGEEMPNLQKGWGQLVLVQTYHKGFILVTDGVFAPCFDCDSDLMERRIELICNSGIENFFSMLPTYWGEDRIIRSDTTAIRIDIDVESLC